jgi:proteic killer suppression protein
VGPTLNVEFSDSALAVIRTADAARTGLPLEVIAVCQRKLLLLDAAPDERTLVNWKSLGYQNAGSGPDERSINLGGLWRLLFTLDDNKHPPTIQVRSIVEYHH